MSKLGEMIRELCPDGVKYKKLGEVAYYAKERIKTQTIEVHNYVGVEHLLQEKSGRELSTSLPNADYVIGFCVDDILIVNRKYSSISQKIWLADCNGGTNGDVLTIRLNEGAEVSPRYLFLYLVFGAFFLL